MYTQTLMQYLAKVPRMPYISDEDTIRYAFERNQLTLTDELLEFQLRFAGYHHQVDSEPYIYGLVHEESAFLAPFDVDFDDENPQNILYTCMDCRPSESRAINGQGVFYKDYEPIAANFTKYLEQRAFRWKMSQNRQWEQINLSTHVQEAVKQEQPGKLEEFYLKEVSDEYSQIYQLGELVIKTTCDEIVAWKVAGSRQELFYFSL